MTGWRVTAAGVVLLAGCTTPGPAPEAGPTTPSEPAATATSPTPAPSRPVPSPTATASPSPTTADAATSDDAPADAGIAAAPSETGPSTASEATTTPAPADAAPTREPERAPPPFAATVEEVVGHPAETRMRGVSWREGCPVPLAELRYLSLPHHDMDGGVRTGELVVRADVVDDVLAAFERLYELGFPITQMRLVDDFGADDDASMRADNTSAFNCRTVAGTDRWSTHAYGVAVDVNPLRNPYVRGDRVDPPEGAAYADRSDHRPGMLHAGSPEVAAFTDRGWGWGGAWSSGKDYQHFSATGG